MVILQAPVTLMAAQTANLMLNAAELGDGESDMFNRVVTGQHQGSLTCRWKRWRWRMAGSMASSARRLAGTTARSSSDLGAPTASASRTLELPRRYALCRLCVGGNSKAHKSQIL